MESFWPHLALMIFFGSSIGVGNDSGAGTVRVFNFSLKFGPRFVGRTRSGGPELFRRLFCSAILLTLDFFSGFVGVGVGVDPTNFVDDCAKLRSIKIFLQTSLNAFAMDLKKNWRQIQILPKVTHNH